MLIFNLYDMIPEVFWITVYFFFILFNIVVVITVVFIDKKSPQSTFAWVLVSIFIPVVGFILYIFLSQNIASKKINIYTKREKMRIDKNIDGQLKLLNENTLTKNKIEEEWISLISLNIKYANSLLLNNKTYELFFDGEDFFPKLIKDIREAKESIDIEMFIIKNDETAKNIISLLIEKSNEGIKVNLLADATGSRTVLSYIKNKTKDNPNFNFQVFFPAKFYLFNLRINYRNHRKIIVIDKGLAYIGGFNFGDSYINKNPRFKFWRDTGIRITGDSVNELLLQFDYDFRFTIPKKISRPNMNVIDFNKLGHTSPKFSAQIISSGPDSKKEEIKHAYLKMISLSENSIYIETPYFIPDNSILEAIQIAALSGVDVKIVVPKIKDHPFVHPASRYYLGVLLKSGVKVYFYENGFLHSKLMICDSQIASMGSANMDIRSFRLNFETNMIIYDKEIVNKLETQFNLDLNHSFLYTLEKYKKRGVITRVKESVFRLLSDIM